jgi:hypothetical protein
MAISLKFGLGNSVSAPISVKSLGGGAVHIGPKIDLHIPNITLVRITIENTIFSENLVNLHDSTYLPGSHSKADLLGGAVLVDTAILFPAVLQVNIQNSTFEVRPMKNLAAGARTPLSVGWLISISFPFF